MKRDKGLYERIGDLDNLKRAFFKAAKGKRWQVEVGAFERSLDARLQGIREQVDDGSFDFGRFRQFEIRDPKRRMIHACPFDERVLHHAIMNICHDSFDRRLIFDTFACRLGKGRESALQRAQDHCAKGRYFLKLDIAGYFGSIDHSILKAKLTRIFKERRLQELFFRIVDSYEATSGKGLPIGTLASQYFANSYLADLDRFAQEELPSAAYIRYMDDFVVWGHSVDELRRFEGRIERFLRTKLALELNRKRILRPCKQGLPFLGMRLCESHRWLDRRGRKRYESRVRQCERDLREGKLDGHTLRRKLDALNAASGLGEGLKWRQRFWRERKELEI